MIYYLGLIKTEEAVHFKRIKKERTIGKKKYISITDEGLIPLSACVCVCVCIHTELSPLAFEADFKILPKILEKCLLLSLVNVRDTEC